MLHFSVLVPSSDQPPLDACAHINAEAVNHTGVSGMLFRLRMLMQFKSVDQITTDMIVSASVIPTVYNI